MFDQDSRQEDIFENVAKGVIDKYVSFEARETSS